MLDFEREKYIYIYISYFIFLEQYIYIYQIINFFFPVKYKIESKTFYNYVREGGKFRWIHKQILT